METKTKFKILLFILMIAFTGFYGFGFLYLFIALFLNDIQTNLVLLLLGSIGFCSLDICVKFITCIVDEIKKNKPVGNTDKLGE